MKDYLEYKRMDKESVIFNKMFEARQIAHVKHLQTKSYAEHKALGSFYEDLLDLVDNFIETYQGQHGIISNYGDVKSDVSKDAVGYITDFAEEIKDFHSNLKGDSHLQNILDEIVALSYRTLYKLKNLK